MFTFGKKDDDQKKSKSSSQDAKNKWSIGWFDRLFLGKKIFNEMDEMNRKFDEIDQTMDNTQYQPIVFKNGADATAEVLSIQDTGATINMNPVLLLTLKVTPKIGTEFQTTA